MKHCHEYLQEICKNIEIIETLENSDYDTLLSENIVCIYLVDASTVNTVLECIVRNTPIIINRHPAVVELLGNDYPLFYNGSKNHFEINTEIYDLLNNNIYKLYVNNELFFVPLWYNEVYFEATGREIIVYCVPEIPEHISLDDDNNIYIDYEIESSDITRLILENRSIDVSLCENINYEIPLSELHMKKEQYYKLKNNGISKGKDNDIHDVSNKSDIIVKITII
jgi:hypothetical protein